MKATAMAITVVMLLALPGGYAEAQRMYLDMDGDGQPTAADILSPKGITAVTLWVETNTRVGDGPAVRGIPDVLLTINSYEVALRAEGGTVKWGRFTNHQSGMNSVLGPFSNETDFYIGQAGAEALPAGKYKLGTLEVTAVSGTPIIRIVPRSSVWQCAGTSFGSKYPGRDNDHTLKLARTEDGVSRTTGDWTDANGLTLVPGAELATAKIQSESAPRFRARILRGPSVDNLRLSVTTTRKGDISVRLFDVSGRLVRVIADVADVQRGVHEFAIPTDGSRLASGVYYFRVESAEGVLMGKVAIVR